MWSLALLVPLSILVLESSASADFQPIGFKDCKSKFKILDVQASGCELKDTPNGKKLCEFKEGTTPRIRIKFVPAGIDRELYMFAWYPKHPTAFELDAEAGTVLDQTVDSLKTQIKAKIGQTFLEFPMADADACKYGVTCPVEEGKEYVYEKGIEIINNYPKDETVQVNWMVNKDDGKAVCIIFLARIVA